MGEVTSSGKDRIITNKGLVKLNMNDDNLLFYDGDKYRMIVGLDADGEPVVKISKPGFNVLEAADDKLIFNSSQNVFKIVTSGTINIPSVNVITAANQYGTNSAATVINHNLPYTPAIIAYIQYGTNVYESLPITKTNGVFATGFALATTEIYVDSTTVTASTSLLALNYTGGGNTVPAYTVKYYLLQETAN